MIPMINTLTLFILFLSRQALNHTNSKNETTALLESEIIKMDSLLFDVAFNKYDAAVFKKIIADDIELYDDRYGLNISNGNKIKALFEKYTRPEHFKRQLISCTINKLGDFGALQVGEHTFFTNGIPETTGKFIHIWERKDQEWKLKRIISYEHKPYKK